MSRALRWAQLCVESARAAEAAALAMPDEDGASSCVRERALKARYEQATAIVGAQREWAGAVMSLARWLNDEEER